MYYLCSFSGKKHQVLRKIIHSITPTTATTKMTAELKRGKKKDSETGRANTHESKREKETNHVTTNGGDIKSREHDTGLQESESE